MNEPNLSDAAFHGGFTNEGAADGRVLLLKNMTGLWILQECVRLWEAAGKPVRVERVWKKRRREAAAFRSFIDPSAQRISGACRYVRGDCAILRGERAAGSADERRVCALRL